MEVRRTRRHDAPAHKRTVLTRTKERKDEDGRFVATDSYGQPYPKRDSLDSLSYDCQWAMTEPDIPDELRLHYIKIEIDSDRPFRSSRQWLKRELARIEARLAGRDPWFFATGVPRKQPRTEKEKRDAALKKAVVELMDYIEKGTAL